MSNRKITDMAALTTPASDDVLPIVDISEAAAADKNKKISIEELFKGAPNGTAAAPSIAFESDSDSGIFLAGTNTVGITTAGTQRVTVDASGNVTIDGDLTVNGATTTIDTTTLIVEDKNIEMGSVTTPTNTTADGGGITLKGATDKTITWVDSTGCWTFNQPTNFNDHVRITSAGLVGIGTAAPFGKLQIKAGTNANFLATTASSEASLEIINDAGSANVPLNVRASEYKVKIGSSEKLRIDSSGNCGVGTSHADFKLDVGGAIGLFESNNIVWHDGVGTRAGQLGFTSGEVFTIGRGSSGTESLRIDASGRLLVGTTTEGEATADNLTIADSGHCGITLRSGTSSVGTIFFSDGTSGADEYRGVIQYDHAGDYFKWVTAGVAERLRLTSDGKLGVGTSAPSVPLTVNSTTDHSDIAIFHAGGGTPDRGLKISTFSNVDANSGVELDAQFSSGAFKFSTGGTERLRIDSSGQLLVGTTSGNGIIRAFGSSGRLIVGDSSVNYYDSNTHIFRNYAATEQMRINSSGNVGIGTTSPNYLLTALAGSGSQNIFQAGQTGVSNGYTISSNGSALTHQWYAGSGEAARIDSSGRVGIGTSSPNHLLTLKGTQAFQATNSTNAWLAYTYTDNTLRLNYNGAGADEIVVDSSGNVGIGTTPNSDSQLHVKSGANDNNPILRLEGATNNFLNFRQTGSVYDINVTASDPLSFTIGSSERMRIDSSGRVGIGTTNPDATLQVGVLDSPGTLRAGLAVKTVSNGLSTSEAAIYLEESSGGEGYYIRVDSDGGLAFDNSGTTTPLYLSDTNNVGIGTSSPSASLHVSANDPAIYIQDANSTGNNVNATFQFRDSSNAQISYLGFAGASDSNFSVFNTMSGGALRFGTASTERMRIDSSGNVGIGLTTNLAGLCANSTIRSQNSSSNISYIGFTTYQSSSTVGNMYSYMGGDARSTGYLNFNTNDTERMRIDSSGKVGIGVSNPGDYHADANSLVTSGGITLANTTQGSIFFADSASGTGEYVGQINYQHTNDSMAFITNNAERMRIDDNGLVSTFAQGNNTNFKIRNAANSSSAIYFIECFQGASSATSGGNQKFTVRTNGGIQNFQSNDSDLSDEREKKNIVSLDAKWDKVKSWDIKKFHYNDDADTDDKRYGVIAQEVAEHCPEVVTDWLRQEAEDAVLDDEGNIVTPAQEKIVRKGIKTQQMMWMAIKALQEAQARIETLETKVAALEAG